VTRPDDERLVEAFSEEARRVAAAAAAGQPPPGAWHRLQARRQATGRRTSWRWAAAASLGALALGLVGWQVARDRAGRPLTYQVAGSAVEDSGYVSAGEGESARLTFSDGTRIQLSPGAKVSVAAPGAHGARVRVQDGRAHFEVVHRPHAAWTVDAGPYAVEVTGTVFDVRWSAAEEVAEVRLRAGSVRVSGPLLTEHATLRPGQNLIARLADHQLRIEDERAAAPAAAPQVPAPAAHPAAPAETAPPPAPAPPAPAAVKPTRKSKPRARQVALVSPPVPAPAPAPWAPRDWGTRVASGDASAIVAEAEAHGIDAVLDEADAPALVALADAARYGGRRDLAARVLLAERRRFPGTPAAGNAAFFLGRLADDQGKPTQALDWYRRYLTEQARGPYASEALGRVMLGVARVSGRAAARELAEEYLDRFPNGTYLLHARQILAAP
jgi:ferric-dicitrate binding protein FerR (iron transport regulator)